MDIKKLGRLRDGGHRMHGRDSDQHRRRDREPGPGYDYVHAAIDDHTRLAYAEVLADERGPICAEFLRRAGAFFAAHGISIQQVLANNATLLTAWPMSALCQQRRRHRGPGRLAASVQPSPVSHRPGRTATH